MEENYILIRLFTDMGTLRLRGTAKTVVRDMYG